MKGGSEKVDQLINKANLATHLDIMTVVLDGIFNGTTKPDTLVDKARFPIDVTFLPFKLTDNEAAMVETLFEASPFEAKEEVEPLPVPNDYYRLKVTLLLTHLLRRGIRLAAADIVSDKTKLAEMKKLSKRAQDVVDGLTSI